VGTQNFRLADIKGFLPSVDPTRTEDMYVLNGRNYVFDVKGPKSVFGNRLLLPQPLQSPHNVQGLLIQARKKLRSFTLAADGILEWDERAGGWQVIYVTPRILNTPYRWTSAYLNRKVYFAHPRVGILVYDIDSETCGPHTGLGVPTEVIAIAENNGVLCAIGPEFFSWSAPSDGMNFNPALGGAGFQRISDRVPGYPIMLSSYTSGCLIWTSGGVMRSEFTGDQAVFRHRALQAQYRPINSFCTARVEDDTVVVLDERGLFASKGEAPTAMTPVFNEFFADYMQKNKLRIGENVRLEWDARNRRLFVSTSLTESNPLYENCFVLYPNLDKWGQFNDPHYGILPISIRDTQRADDYFGYVDSDGRVRFWMETSSRELRPEETAGIKLKTNLYYPPIQKPVGYEEGAEGFVVSSSAVCASFATGAMNQPAGYYLPDGLTPITPERTGLDSRVMLGLFRPNGQQVSDELSELINLVIRNNINDTTQDDGSYNITPAPSGDQTDLGLSDTNIPFDAEANYVNHGLRVIGTVDGRTEFMSETPILAGFTNGARYYTCAVTGVWHIFELSAVEIGEAFHPATFEITATSAGRLN
jgi:hypothetical protein